MSASFCVLLAAMVAACGGPVPQPPPDTRPPDADGDGVSDEFDLCPDEAETWNLYLDTDGCADVAPKIVSVDPALGGTWHGVLRIEAGTGAALREEAATVLVQTNGGPEPFALATGMCPDGKGIMGFHRVEESVPAMAWRGTLECDAEPFGGCADARVTYISAFASVRQDGSVAMTASGTWSGCGVDGPADIVFTGTH